MTRTTVFINHHATDPLRLISFAPQAKLTDISDHVQAGDVTESTDKLVSSLTFFLILFSPSLFFVFVPACACCYTFTVSSNAS